MVRLTEIIALGAIALVAGVGGFKLNELLRRFRGEDIIPDLPPLPELPTLPTIPNPFDGLFGGNDKPPIVIGPITDVSPSPDLVPTPQEREEGNQSIIDKLGLAQVGPFDRPLFLDEFPLSPIPSSPVTASGNVAGGGPSFIGGTINEIPISNMSLADIIDRFNVSASQAVNIREEARGGFDDVDLGTNTSRGIGSVFTNPDIATFVNRGVVSNPEFEGLTPTEIVKRLVGGNINNF